MSALNDSHVPASFYLQVEPSWSYGGKLVGAKAVRLSQNKPTRPLGGSVMVKMTVHVPRAAFLPLQPEAVVVIPENMTETTPVHVEAQPLEEIDG